MKHHRLAGTLGTWAVCLGVMAIVATGCPPKPCPPLPTPERSYGGGLGQAIKAGIASGSTVRERNEVTPECDGAGAAHSAPDVSYTWVAPYTDSFTIDTFGSAFDTVLLVRTYQGSTLVDCNDDAAAGSPQSSLTLSLQAGVAYILTVDGHGDSAGNYQLNIDSVSCPGGCEPEPNGCYGPVNFCDTARRTCVHTYIVDTACDDGNPCTLEDRCNGSGECVAGPAMVCSSPPDQCHASSGTCDAATGQCRYATLPANTPCDDTDPCTSQGVCDAEGHCMVTAMVCSLSQNSCYASGTCNSATGQCGYTFKSAGEKCDDGKRCTVNDMCNQAGQCGGTAVVCTSPKNGCYAPIGTCNPTTGDCSYVPLRVGTTCDDGNPCTADDRCDGAGQCAGTAKVCNTPENSCHAASGTCNPATGECSYAFKDRNTRCDLPDRCTINEKCDGAGHCVGEPMRCGESSNGCSILSCNPDTGQCTPTAYKDRGTPCTETNRCISGRVCDGHGRCEQGTMKVCPPPQEECRVSSCNPVTGQCVETNAPYGTPCHDEWACQRGVCERNGACTIENLCPEHECYSATCLPWGCRYTRVPGCVETNPRVVPGKE